MQAIVVREIGSFKLEQRPRPQPGIGEVLVAVAVAGLCRTDLKIIETGHRDLVLPRIPAEEVVGTVCEVGPNGDHHLIGQRVYLYPGTSCYECVACRSGAENLCDHMKIMGFHRDGGFADYVVAPRQSLIALPADLPFETAIFAEPLSCCLNALELSALKKNEHIGIWGAGPAGTLLARGATALGGVPHVFDPDPVRHKRIDGRKEPETETFDVAIVAVGSDAAYLQAIAHLRPRGRLVVFSGLTKGREHLPIDFNQLHYREQSIIGAYGCSLRHSEQALALLADHQVLTHDMISHRLPLNALERGLDLVRQRKGMKILLYPQMVGFGGQNG